MFGFCAVRSCAVRPCAVRSCAATPALRRQPQNQRKRRGDESPPCRYGSRAVLHAAARPPLAQSLRRPRAEDPDDQVKHRTNERDENRGFQQSDEEDEENSENSKYELQKK